MEYKKIEKKGYNLYTYQTDKFYSSKIIFSFKNNVVKENITKNIVLSNIIKRVNNKYKTYRELLMAQEDRFILNISSFNVVSLDKMSVDFQLDYLNGDEYLKDAIDFATTIIFDLKIKNNKLSKEELNIVKKKVHNDIIASKENNRLYAYDNFHNIVEPNSPLSYPKEGEIEVLKTIDEENLYSYYKEIIDNSNLDIIAIGNINEDLLIEKLDTIFSERINGKIVFKTYELTPSEMVKEEKLTIKANQSNLLIGYKISNISEYEANAVLPLMSDILGGKADSRLFQFVREKHSLCYYIRSNYNRLANLFYIEAGITKESYDKSLKLIKEQFQDVISGNIDAQELSNSKINLINSLETLDDDKLSILSYLKSMIYHSKPDVNDLINMIKEVTKEDIMNLKNKINLDTIFLLEGVPFE